MFFSGKRVFSTSEPPSQAWGGASLCPELGHGPIFSHAWGLGVEEGFPTYSFVLFLFLARICTRNIFWFIHQILTSFAPPESSCRIDSWRLDNKPNLNIFVWDMSLKRFSFLLFLDETVGLTSHFFVSLRQGSAVSSHKGILGKEGCLPCLSLDSPFFPFSCENFDRAWFSIYRSDFCPL